MMRRTVQAFYSCKCVTSFSSHFLILSSPRRGRLSHCVRVCMRARAHKPVCGLSAGMQGTGKEVRPT